MRVVQTFWSGNKDPLNNSFGWYSPQYNLMSWALSCLSLRENYDEVILYTDFVGYKIFAEQLKLPYTDIIVQYDNLKCPEHHWAYPKLLTYSIQNKPFIHVDGDVYLPKKLDQRIEVGDLISQNKEIGTPYYKNMMNAIMQSDIDIPDFLAKELKKDSISSFNAGIIGGHDLDFIQEYCKKAFHFIEANHLNDINNHNINVNHNILFEQILFSALSKEQNKRVSTVLDHDIRDNGYTYQEFCDFYSFDTCDLMHIIGGHKRNERVCELLSRTLLNKFPEYHQKITELFPAIYRRSDIAKNKQDEACIRSYNNFITELSIQWDQEEEEYLLDIEKESCNYLNFFNNYQIDTQSMIISRNPYLSIYEISDEWSDEAKQILKHRIGTDFLSNNFDIACIPSLLNEGYKELLIDDLAYNILLLLEKEKSVKVILKEIRECFPIHIRKNNELIYSLLIEKLEYLFYNKLIYTKNIIL